MPKPDLKLVQNVPYHVVNYWRNQAHQYFDILWRVKIARTGCSMELARSQAYEWLAKKMKLQIHRCHMKQMNVKQCKKVVMLCQRFDLKKMQKEITEFYK